MKQYNEPLEQGAPNKNHWAYANGVRRYNSVAGDPAFLAYALVFSSDSFISSRRSHTQLHFVFVVLPSFRYVKHAAGSGKVKANDAV